MAITETKLRELIAADEGQYHDRKSLFVGPPGQKRARDRREVRDLRAGRPAHASRNPRVARVLAELGVMRDLGEGIPRMFEEMEGSFLSLPELDIVGGRFRVVLRKTPIFAVDDPEWLRSVRALPISLAQKRALVAFVDGELTNRDYAALNALDRDAAYRDLADLAERGLVEVSGTGAGTTYRVMRGAVSALPPTTPIERSSGWIGIGPS